MRPSRFPLVSTTGGKDANMYVLNRGSLGGYNTTQNNVVQTIAFGGLNFSTPVYFNNSVYVCSSTVAVFGLLAP